MRYLRETLEWSETAAQSVLGAVYASFAIWRLSIVHTLRPLGQRRSTLFGAATYPLFVVALLAASWFSPGAAIAGALVVSIIWGWGAASMWLTSGARVLNEAKDSRYGLASGVFYACANVGFAAGVLIYDQILQRVSDPLTGHRARLIVAAAFGIAGLICLSRVSPKDMPLTTRVGNPLRFLRYRGMVVASALMFASAIGFALMLSVFPNYLRETVATPVLSSAAMFPLARAILSITGSPSSDRWGRGTILFISFGVGAGGLAFAAFHPTAWSAALAAFALGLQGGVVPPVATAIVGDVVSDDERPFALGAVFFWRDLAVVLVFALSVTRAAANLEITQRGMMAGFAGLFAVCAMLAGLLNLRERATR